MNTSKSRNTGFGRLTDYQRGILAFHAWGVSRKVLANECGVSIKTIDNHFWRIKRTLKVESLARLTHCAIANGLVPLVQV